MTAIVERIAASSTLTVRIGKEAFCEQVELDEHGAYELTRRVMAGNAQAGDAQEGRARSSRSVRRSGQGASDAEVHAGR